MCPLVFRKSTGKRKQQQPSLPHPGTLPANTYQKTLLELPISSALEPKPCPHPCSHSPSSCHTAVLVLGTEQGHPPDTAPSQGWLLP